jgi:hypothetical protein
VILNKNLLLENKKFFKIMSFRIQEARRELKEIFDILGTQLLDRQKLVKSLKQWHF